MITADKLRGMGGVNTGVYDEDLSYTSLNIATEFPSGNNTNIDSSSGALVATGSNGEAISLVKTQDDGQSDFTALTSDTIPFQGEFEFANISDATSSANTLITSTPIQDGDNLVLVLDDNSINEIVASGVVETIGDYAPSTDAVFNGFNIDSPDIASFGDGKFLQVFQDGGNSNYTSFSITDNNGIMSGSFNSSFGGGVKAETGTNVVTKTKSKTKNFYEDRMLNFMENLDQNVEKIANPEEDEEELKGNDVEGNK